MMSGMMKSELDFEKRFGQVLGEFRRRFPERRWTLWRGDDLLTAACVSVPDGDDGVAHGVMVLGLCFLDSSPERFLEGVLKDVGPHLLGTKAGFSSLEELDLFLESVGRGTGDGV